MKSTRADFYPSLRIQAGLGYQAFNLSYLIEPASLLYSMAGDLVAPVINRKALKANYLNANARQIQAIYRYDQTILQAYLDVENQLSNIQNLSKSYVLREAQVEALNKSVEISNSLFRSARADYMEVLLTQRDVLEARFDLIETRLKQFNARVNVYRALGGGWR